LELHPELSVYNRWVTVFYGGRELKDYENIYAEDKKLKVLRLGENNVIKEGYLLRTNVVLMFVEFQEKNTVELPYGKYEALYFIRRV